MICKKECFVDIQKQRSFRDVHFYRGAWHRTVGSTDLQFFTGPGFNLQNLKK